MNQNDKINYLYKKSVKKDRQLWYSIGIVFIIVGISFILWVFWDYNTAPIERVLISQWLYVVNYMSGIISIGVGMFIIMLEHNKGGRLNGVQPKAILQREK